MRKWWSHLKFILKDVAEMDYKPIIIAISRKMPRFLEWFRSEAYKIDTFFADANILDDIEITTELAIPFLYVKEDMDDYEFIILDDSLIHGSTMKRVSEMLYSLSGKTSRLSSILINGTIDCPDYVFLPDWIKTLKGTLDEIVKLTDVISELVESTCLPIDMEFPIFNIKERRLNYQIAKTYSYIRFKNGFYEVGNSPERFSINLGSEESVGFNNEFSKVRFFKSSEELKVEVFSPNIFSEDQLKRDGNSIFGSGNLYARAWDIVTLKLRQMLTTKSDYLINSYSVIYHETVKSLCMWLNYLYSIACFTFNVKRIFKVSDVSRIFLSKKDLDYILGNSMGNEIYPLLCMIIISKQSAYCKLPMPLRVPDSFAPSVFSQELERVKFTKALTSSDPSELLQGIFSYGHFTNPKFDNPHLAKERLYFGETFHSIVALFKLKLNTRWDIRCISAWIDLNIDKGYLVPRYECVKSIDGNIYWRRFFHSGARKFD